MFLKSHMSGLRILPLAVVLVAASAGFATVNASAASTDGMKTSVVYSSLVARSGNLPS